MENKNSTKDKIELHVYIDATGMEESVLRVFTLWSLAVHALHFDPPTLVALAICVLSNDVIFG